MTNFNFYTEDKAYGEFYFQFPKVFLYSDKYKDLSDSAKIAYMILKDRLQSSIMNKWVDEHRRVYFIFTNKELEELLNCHNQKVIKIKKELEDFGLLLQVKRENGENRLYLRMPEATQKDINLYKNN